MVDHHSMDVERCEKDLSSILAFLNWENQDLEEDSLRNDGSALSSATITSESGKRSCSWYDAKLQPNIVVLPPSLTSGYDNHARLKNYKESVDLGMLERIDRDITPMKESAFEVLLSDTSIQGNKMKQDMIAAQKDFKRRRKKYRGGSISNRSAKEVMKETYQTHMNSLMTFIELTEQIKKKDKNKNKKPEKPRRKEQHFNRDKRKRLPYQRSLRYQRDGYE